MCKLQACTRTAGIFFEYFLPTPTATFGFCLWKGGGETLFPFSIRAFWGKAPIENFRRRTIPIIAHTSASFGATLRRLVSSLPIDAFIEVRCFQQSQSHNSCVYKNPKFVPRLSSSPLLVWRYQKNLAMGRKSLTAILLAFIALFSNNDASHEESSSSSLNGVQHKDHHAISLPFGDVNVLVLTDVHSWIAGHERHESELNVDYGDVLSFYQYLKEYIQKYNQGDLLLVMNGDFMDGTGLSTEPPTHLTPLLEQMPWDLINMGNHELYFNETVDWIKQEFIPHLSRKDTIYLTSNTLLESTKEPIGKRYTYVQLPNNQNNATLLAFGFLYNFENHCDNALVEHVEDVVQQEWFRTVLQDIEKYDAILVLAHMHVTDPLVSLLLEAIRNNLPQDIAYDMPIQFLTGHTHIRGFAVLDDVSTSMEAGRYLDTIGFCSFPLLSTTQRKNHGHPTEITTAREQFSHVFLDTNRQYLSHLIGNTSGMATTSEGKALQQQIHQTQESLGLLETIGCSPQQYHLYGAMEEHYNGHRRENLSSSSSLWNLYMYHVVPNTILSHWEFASSVTTEIQSTKSPSVIFVQGTGALRYDLFAGKVVLDDIIAVCPFNDTIYQVTTTDQPLMGKELLEALNMETTTRHPNRIVHDGSTLPRWAISLETIHPYQHYTVLTTHFHRDYLVHRIKTVISKDRDPASLVVTPKLVYNPKTGQAWTSTNLWRQYIEQTWPCGKSTEEKPHPKELEAMLDQDEKPLVAGLFIGLLLCGLWLFQKRKRQLQRLDYMPIGDPAMEFATNSIRALSPSGILSSSQSFHSLASFQSSLE